jgi:hypothetical protein
VLGVAAALAMVSSLASYHATRWYGRPIGGALVDPGARISNFGPANLDAKLHGFRFPDRVAAVDGQLVAGDARVFDRAVAEAARAGRGEIAVTIETARGSRETKLKLVALEPWAWWVFAATCIGAGVLWAAAGLLALWVSPRGALARTSAKFGVLVGLFQITLFDFHTSRAMVPLFFLAYATVPLGWVALALRLPDDAPLFVRAPWLEHAFDALGLGGALALIVTHGNGQLPLTMQLVVSWAFVVCLLAFVVIFVVRFVRARGKRRATMRALLLGMIPPHVLGGSFAFLTATGNRPITDAFYPLLGLAPLATLYAFVRYDIWDSRALLSRLLTRVALALGSCAVASGVGTAIAVSIGAPFRSALLAAICSSLVAAALVAFAWRLGDRWLFPARAAYRPTVAKVDRSTAKSSRSDAKRSRASSDSSRASFAWPCSESSARRRASAISAIGRRCFCATPSTHEGWCSTSQPMRWSAAIPTSWYKCW